MPLQNLNFLIMTDFMDATGLYAFSSDDYWRSIFSNRSPSLSNS